jgi:hypothetical protein
MENDDNPDRPKVRPVRAPKRYVSRTRIVMGLLLIAAMAVFVSLANKAVHENADALRQIFGQ